jgi:PAS domain-containing protein
MAKLLMTPTTSLSHKGLALVLIPLFIQCSLFLSAIWLYGQAEADADKAYNAGKISNTVNQLVRDLFDIASLSPGEASRIADTGFEGDANRIWQDIQNLKTAVSGDPDKEAIVANTAEAAITAHQILLGLHKVYVNDGPLVAFEMLKESSKELRLCIKRMVSRELLSMAQREEMVEQQSPLVQARLRQEIKLLLVTGIVFSIALTVFMAVLFYRGIIKRLQIIVDNSYRLASSMPLNPPLKSKDEIGLLDNTFHNMATTLAYVKEREKALINHSLDLICSIDDGLRFAALNPASEQILGFSPDQLLRSRLSSVVIEEDWSDVRNRS